MRAYAINNKPTVRYVPVPEPAHDNFSGEPTTFTQLLSAIRRANSLKRLQHLVSSHSDRFDAVHVAAAVARLPRLIKYRPADLVDRSDAVVVPTPGLARVRRKHGAKPLLSHVQDGAQLAAQLDALLPAHVKHFFPRQAACTIWAFGELRRMHIVDQMESLPDVLLALTKGDLEPLRVHGHGVDFAQLLQGLGKLGHRDPHLVERLVPLLRAQLGSMPQREIQMSAWGLASLGFKDLDLFNLVADQLLHTGTAFLLPSGCAAVFWAFAKVGLHRPDLLNSLSGSMVGQALLLAPQDVATTLWACSRLEYQNTQLFAVLGDAMVRALPSSSDWEVSSAVEALGNLGYHHVPLMDAVQAAILSEPVIGADPTCIARVLCAFGKLGRRGQRDMELVSLLAAALTRHLPNVKEEVLASVGRSLHVFDYRDEAFLSALASRAERLLPGCSDVQVLSVLRLLGGVGHPHFQLAVASARHLETTIIRGGKYRSLSAVIEVLYLCARQGVEDPAAAEALLALAAAHEGELLPVDAARLVVLGQVMNRKEPLLNTMADVVMRQATGLDGDTAEAALRSAQAMGRHDLATVLSSQLHNLSAAGQQQGGAAAVVL